MPQEKVKDLLQRHQAALDLLVSQQFDDLEQLGQDLTSAFNNGNKLLIAGSGLLSPVGNIIASMFQHRLHLERPPLPAFALGNDLALGPSLQRDHLDEHLHSRQFDIIGRSGDILLLLADGKHDPSLHRLAEDSGMRNSPLVLIKPNTQEWNGRTPDVTIHLSGETGGEIAATALFCGQMLCSLVEHALFGI